MRAPEGHAVPDAASLYFTTMPRIALRRRTSSAKPSHLAAAIALGLGLGIAAGFVLGELAGPIASRALRRRPKRAERESGLVSRLVLRAQRVLNDDLPLRDCRLHVVAIGPGRIELHGWVADRRSRARAAHLVSDAVDADAIINCLLVHGEDDAQPTDDDDDKAGAQLA